MSSDCASDGAGEVCFDGGPPLPISLTVWQVVHCGSPKRKPVSPSLFTHGYHRPGLKTQNLTLAVSNSKLFTGSGESLWPPAVMRVYLCGLLDRLCQTWAPPGLFIGWLSVPENAHESGESAFWSQTHRRVGRTLWNSLELSAINK